MFVLAYVILHVFLGVPTRAILTPYLAFCALTLALVLGGYWANRYGERIESKMPFLHVLTTYGLLFFPLWAHFFLALGIGKPKVVARAVWIGEVLWCLDLVCRGKFQDWRELPPAYEVGSSLRD
jgi:hypothetical protein